MATDYIDLPCPGCGELRRIYPARVKDPKCGSCGTPLVDGGTAAQPVPLPEGQRKAEGQAANQRAVKGRETQERERAAKEREKAWADARAAMNETLSPAAEQHLADLLTEGEQVIFKVRSSPEGERSQAVLTSRNFIIFSKGLFGGQGQDVGGGLLGLLFSVGQLSVRVFPLGSIRAFEFHPQQGPKVGHFQVLGPSMQEHDNETKFLIDTAAGYFKAVLIYKKILELQARPHG